MWSYTGFSRLQLDLIARRVVDLSGDVDPDMAKYVREALLRLKAEGSPDIEIRISSGGGQVIYGLDIYDMLRLYEGKTRGIAFGAAASIAAVILQACSVRCAAANSRIMIHHINKDPITLDDLRLPKKIAKLRKEMESIQRRLYAILSARTKRPIKQIRLLCAKDREMLAPEALELGLIDKVL